MNENLDLIDDLKEIKKHYGEKMMQLCRTLFPTLLEEKGLLSKIIMNNFESNRSLYEDLDVHGKMGSFKNFIYSLVERAEKEVSEEIETPEKLLANVGYVLYECQNEDDIQFFKKYYKKDEELCTFIGERLNRCHVFFAVKKDVDLINRKDFENPDRQDKYGTSVISIQFTKDKSQTLSIKNRYNHKVVNPDATFSNNLDNIIVGLTDSFAKHYGMLQENTNIFELFGYVRANDGKYYKYNHEINNIYYCPNNIIIDNFEVKKLSTDKNIVIDYFVLDLEEKKLKLFDERIEDSFVEIFPEASKIELKKIEENKEIMIFDYEGKASIKITVDKNNKIIGLVGNNLTQIENAFLFQNKDLRYLELPQLQTVGNAFLTNNKELRVLELPQLQTVGDGFLYANSKLRAIETPQLQTVGDSFLYANSNLITLELRELQTAGHNFLYFGKFLENLELPLLQAVGDGFLFTNKTLKTLKLPQLQTVGNDFLHDNKIIETVELPLLQTVEHSFLGRNEGLETLHLPNLEKTGEDFIWGNSNIKTLELPQLQTVGQNFLLGNKGLETLKLPQLQTVGNRFLHSNKNLKNLKLPQLQIMGNEFLYCNIALETLELPKLEKAGQGFLLNNDVLLELKAIYSEKTKTAESGFFENLKPKVENILDTIKGRKR